MFRAIPLLLITVLTTGCQSSLQRLAAAVHDIQKQSGEVDRTARVFVVLSNNPPIRALTALNDPKHRYLAYNRFVTVVFAGSNNVTLYYKDLVNSYKLKSLMFVSYEGSPLYGRYVSERAFLYEELIGRPTLLEHVVVCDLQMNPIESETPGNTAYPTLLTKYGRYTDKDYNEWLAREQAKAASTKHAPRKPTPIPETPVQRLASAIQRIQKSPE